MAVSEPVKVKGPGITSNDVVSFAGGLDERGDYNISPDSVSFMRNMMVNSSGNVIKRLVKQRWLPDTVGFNGEISTIYYGGNIYYFVADDEVVKYCQDGDTSWTVCGGDNAVNTDTGVITTFMRTNNWLLIMNGEDEMRYVDLSSFNVAQFKYVADPVSNITATATGITISGPYKVYYAFTYNSNGGGETGISPILPQSVSKSRTTWKKDGTEYLTLTFNDTPPADATSRNLYGAVALQGVSPSADDLVRLSTDIPLTDATFADDGSAQFDINIGTAPKENTTRGIKAKAGLMVGNTPMVYGDPDSPYDLHFGALTETGVTFGSSGGGQRLPLLKGTNFYPTSVVGFRNNQNIPNLLALFSNTEGVSKQQIISQKTLTYGNTIINYWGADDLNIGASTVYSIYGVIVYLGELIFPSSDGITSIKTEQNLQNVLSPSIISDRVSKTYKTIKNTNFNKIVGTAWNNLVVFAVPSRGFNHNNQLLVRDMSNKDKPKWSIWDLGVDWIGAVSPQNKSSFMYIRQGNKFFKLVEAYYAEDDNDKGTTDAVPLVVEGALLPFSRARNSFFAITQAVFYLAEFVGAVTISVSYVNKKGKVKTKTKVFRNGDGGAMRVKSGWANQNLLWRSWNNRMINWSTPMTMSDTGGGGGKVTKRCVIRLPNPVVNEVKFKISATTKGTSFDLVNGTYEGVSLGVIGDV